MKADPSAVSLSVATCGFEAARRFDSGPEHRRGRSLHGHSFQASVFAELPRGWSSFAGAEVDALRQRLQACVAPLDYACLNEQIEDPSDANIARWIRQAMGVPGIARVAVQSTPLQGVDLDRDRQLHAWRRFRFQSAHRLPNVPLGHKCGRMHGHGFEAVLHLRQAAGTQAVDSGHERLDALWAPLHMELNYRCLNEIAGLDNPTSERIAQWIWQRLKPAAPELAWVTVFETASCGANFDGKAHRIWKEFTLDSAAALRKAPAGHPRAGLHGHTYTLRLHMHAPLDEVRGWTVDFGEVKQAFAPIFHSLDHQSLLEIEGMADGDSASIARWILEQGAARVPGLVRVDLYETRGCGTVLMHELDGPALPV